MRYNLLNEEKKRLQLRMIVMKYKKNYKNQKKEQKYAFVTLQLIQITSVNN